MRSKLFRKASQTPRRHRRFLSDEDGAVTVDWVVLTAGAMGLAISVAALLMGYVEPGSDNIGSEIGNYEIETSFD